MGPRGRWHSVSSTQSYERCPRSYHFGYVQRTKTDVRSPQHWRFGTVVHEGLAAGYRKVQEEKADPASLYVRAAAGDEVRASWIREEMPAAGGELDRALEMVDVALEEHPPLDPADILGVECKLVHSTPDGSTVIGYADLAKKAGEGGVEIVDHKVTSHKMKAEFLVDDFQGNTYGWLATQEWPWAKQVYFTHHYPPSRDWVTVRLGPEGIEDALSRIECSAESIEMDEEFRPRVGEQCQWCTYKPLCPAWTGENAALMEEVARF